MPTTRELRRRIRSVKTTRQITRAMELVASSKLRSAIKTATASREYANGLQDTLTEVIGSSDSSGFSLMVAGSGNRQLVVAFSSDQGLAGMFHSNNLKAAIALPETTDFYALGKRLQGSLKRLGRPLVGNVTTLGRSVNSQEIGQIADEVVSLFESGNYTAVSILSTDYHTALVQTVVMRQLIPVAIEKSVNYSLLIEPDPEVVGKALLQQTIRAALFSAATQTKASEFAIRRTAMHAATENAGDLIERYTLAYNRARQAAITTEIAEIVGGAAALSQ